MKNSEFISKCIFDTRSRRNGNIFSEGGRLFSYGYHFPLLINIENKSGNTVRILNSRRYSNSTGRHQSYAREYADVELPLVLRECDIPKDNAAAIQAITANAKQHADALIEESRKIAFNNLTARRPSYARLRAIAQELEGLDKAIQLINS